MVRTEHCTKAAKAGDDLIGNQQNVMAIKNRLNGRPVTGWRGNNAAGAENRLTDKGRYCISTFFFDKR